MFGFLKNRTQTTEIVETNSTEKEKEENSSLKATSGYAATESARVSTQQAATKFAKPDSYTGNRKLYDSGAAKKNAKLELFKNGNDVVDPYTGDKLVLTKNEAKMKYGEEWQRHLAESDHVKSLEQIHNDTKGNVWVTTDDIKSAANSSDNIKVTSRKFNNAKRSRTNKEYVEDTEYLENKGVKLAEGGKEAAIRDEEIANASVNRQLRSATVKNVVKTGHEAGKYGAKNAGVTAATMSGIMNVIALIKGEKDTEEALKDTIKDGGKAAATGYVMSGGLTVVSHALTESSSKFLRALSESNVPGKVITAVMVTGDTLKRYGNGEISTQECLIELGEKGLNLATTGYFMAAGQAIIPVPIVGAAVGALVGSVVTSKYYNELITTLKTKQLEHQERQRIIAECRKVAEEARAFREELETYLEGYFQEYQDCFDEALSEMKMAFEMGDADGIIAGANEITRKLGGEVHYETVEEFKSFLVDDTVDIF